LAEKRKKNPPSWERQGRRELRPGKGEKTLDLNTWAKEKEKNPHRKLGLSEGKKKRKRKAAKNHILCAGRKEKERRRQFMVRPRDWGKGKGHAP